MPKLKAIWEFDYYEPKKVFGTRTFDMDELSAYGLKGWQAVCTLPSGCILLQRQMVVEDKE